MVMNCCWPTTSISLIGDRDKSAFDFLPPFTFGNELKYGQIRKLWKLVTHLIAHYYLQHHRFLNFQVKSLLWPSKILNMCMTIHYQNIAKDIGRFADLNSSHGHTDQKQSPKFTLHEGIAEYANRLLCEHKPLAEHPRINPSIAVFAT